MTRSQLLAVARGDAPADLVLRGARLVNVLSGEIHDADVAVAGGRVIGWGDYHGVQEIDLAGAYLLPGLLDAHVHIESSLLSVGEFARAVAAHGTTGAFVDPHEVANVCGAAGVEWVLRAAAGLPVEIWVNVPSCVPASPFDDPGAVLGPAEVADLLARPGVCGLAEMMNYPGTIFGDAEIDAKLDAAAGRPIDGHAPGISGRDVMAYFLAGPQSDHECTNAAEAIAKLRAGCWLFIREGSATKNLAALLPALNPHNARRICLCCDDIASEDLVREGHIDRIVREVIAAGVDPVTAVTMATLNTAERFGVAGRCGAIAPGRQADFVVVDDLTTFEVRQTWKAGVKIAEEGQALFQSLPVDDTALRGSVRVAAPAASDFALPWAGGPIKVIEVYPNLILTGAQSAEPRVEDGLIRSDVERDLLKGACLERHGGSGQIGLGLLKGFGLRRGALASTVGHDSHNITVVGVTDRAMARATAAVVEAGGGLAVADDEEVLYCLALPLAGLMSDRPVHAVAAECRELRAAAASLGTPLPDPFMTLSFVSLSVIPALRLTPRGLVDVNRFELVGLPA
jgi:adenine deaminase